MINSAISERASSQRGMVTRPDLVEIGLSSTSIENRRESLRLLPIGSGVYSLGLRIEDRLAIYLAAILTSGGNSFLYGKSAADLWGFRRHSGIIEVVRSESRSPSKYWLDSRGVKGARKVHVHRSRVLGEAELSRFQGIPVLEPARVLLDLAAELPAVELDHAFKEADRLGRLAKDALFRCAARNKGWPGIREFRRLVMRRHPGTREARSLLEVLFLDICARHGLGDPEVNRASGRFYPDFRWEELKLVVEVDGYEGHAGRSAFLDDAHRENELRALGYQVIRFTWEEVNERPEWVASLVRREIERCRRLSGGDSPS